MFLADISIKRPVMMSMILIVFVLFGGLAFVGMNLQLMPDMTLPMITVQTIYPGAGPEELELQVTKKIEDEVAAVSGIDYIQSFSMENLSYVMITFEMEKDVYEALQEVKDKIDGILNDFPDDAERPIVQRFDPLNEPVVDMLLSGPIPITELYDIADKRLSAQFAQIPGVANVQVVGGQEREVRIELDNRTILQHSVNITQLAQILAMQNMDMPGGNIKRSGQEYSVRLNGEFESVEEIRDIEVPTANGMKRLGDIAEIADTGEEVRERTTYFNNITGESDQNVIQVSLVKTSDGNAVEIHEDAKAILPEVIAQLPHGCNLEIINENATFIQEAVNDTMTNILLGIILTSLVLFFFLHDYKSTIIVALSMPMSIISTFLFMQAAGFSLNVMSLMGLSTAVGVLVANSVVVLENIFRHKSLGKNRREAASKGTGEIAVAVIASTLTNLAVFLPLAGMSSIAGQIFRQFSLTVVFATIFSLIMSFTLTPMLASLILPEVDRKKRPIGDALERLFRSWEKMYQGVLRFLFKSKWRGVAAIALAIVLLVLSVKVGGTIGFEFMPSMDEGMVGVKVELPIGYDLDETAKVMNRIENEVKKYPEVTHIWTTLGRQGETSVGVQLAYLKAKLKDKDQRTRSTDDLQVLISQDMALIPNAKILTSAASSMGSGRSDMEFDLVGPELKQLEEINRELEEKISKVEGLINLTTSYSPGKPEIAITPHRNKLAQTGLTIMDLALAVRSGISGTVASYYKDKGEEYDIRVQLTDQSIDSPQEIGNILVMGANGSYRLNQLADISFTTGYSQIQHKDRLKSVNYSFDVGMGSIMGDLQLKVDEVVAGMDLPRGYRIKWGGMVEEMDNTNKDMARAFIIAIILTYMLLAAILESLVQPFLILGTIPLAMIGVFLGLAIAGLSMNIISMLSIIMLIGIVVNNAILLLDYTNQLVREGGMSVQEALLEACPTKLKPILMSTTAIILGMLPMAVGIGSSAVEVRQPMGVVAIGGLLVSTILSLYIIPVLYNVFTRKRRVVTD